MTDAPKLGFTPFARLRGVLVVFCGENLKFGSATQRALAPVGDLVRRAAAADRFTGKNGTTLDIVAPTELKLPRLVVVGTGKDSELKRKDVVKLGGIAMGKVPAVAAEATIFAEFASGALKGDQVADLVLGARLRAYTFDRYKTKRKDDDERPKKVEVNFACGNPAAAEKAWADASGLADGVVIARDLVNEPANVLYPGEFARRASSLSKLGVGVEVLDVAAMKKLGMGALLGVGQGSVHEFESRRHALERRQARRRAGGLHRQGRVFRYRRHFDQAGGRHGGHEGRHGRRGLRGRPHACAGRAQGQGQRGRRHRPGREHARRQGAAARRHRHDHVGPDHRDHQYRRRGPFGARRRAALRQQALQTALHDQSGDADRRHHRRARPGICRHVRQRRQARPSA